eukprot:jgi/Mesvir1/8147/Mv25344-RA.1
MEDHHRIKACMLLQMTAERLSLPQQAVATSLVLFHRTVAKTPRKLSLVKSTVAACIFLASKLCECGRRVSDVLNVLGQTMTTERALASYFGDDPKGTSGREGGDGADHAPAAPAAGGKMGGEEGEWEVLVGAKYYEAKDELLMEEQVVLRSIQFQVSIDLPYRYLLNLCHAVRASKALAQVAVYAVNDSLVYTTLCLRHHPFEVAAAALNIGALLVEQAEALPKKGDTQWWDAIGVNRKVIEGIGHEMLAIYNSEVAAAE